MAHLACMAIVCFATDGLRAAGGRAGHSKDFYRHWAVRVTLGHDQTVLVPFDLADPWVPADLQASQTSENGKLRVKLTRYLPNAEIAVAAEPDPAGVGGPAVELELNVAGSLMRRWLRANDPQHGKLPPPAPLSYVQLTEGRTLKDELEYLKGLASEKPKLILRDPSRRRRPTMYPLREGDNLVLLDGRIKVRVEQLLTDFQIDPKTKKLTSRSDELKNPAAVLQIDSGEGPKQAILFGRFPGFSKNIAHHGYRLELRWPVAKTGMGLGHMVLIDSPDGPLDLLLTQGPRIKHLKIKAGETQSLAGKHVSVKLVRRLPSARVEVTAKNAGNILKRPAVHVVVSQGAGPARELWVTRRPVTRLLPDGLLRIRLGVRGTGGGKKKPH